MKDERTNEINIKPAENEENARQFSCCLTREFAFNMDDFYGKKMKMKC